MSLDLSALTNSTKTDNHSSPFGEAGLLLDPLAYVLGKKYKNFMRKTFELPNKVLSPALKKFDKFDRKINPIHRAIDKTEIGGKIADFVHNKPADSAGAILGSIFGGALLGGGGAAGGGATSGAVAAPEAGTLGGLGGGTAGATSAAEAAGLPEIVVTGPAGGGGGATLGGLGAGAGAATQAAQPQTQQSQEEKWQDRFQQQGGGQQQEQQKAQTPYVGRAAELERARQAAEEADRQKRAMVAASLRAQGVYTPA